MNEEITNKMDEEVRDIEKKVRVIKKQVGVLMSRLRNVKKAKEFYVGRGPVRKKKPEEPKQEVSQ